MTSYGERSFPAAAGISVAADTVAVAPAPGTVA